MNSKTPGQLVTMKDVANACGVSVVTVSRALKGDRNHSSETRARIEAAAKMLGYRANPLVSALMSARGRHKPAKTTVNLALLNPGGNPNWPEHPFYQGVIRQAAALGFSIGMFEPGRAGGLRRLHDIMQSRGIRGIIVLPAPEADWRLDVDLTDYAAATIGYSVTWPDMPRVVTDTYGRIMGALTRSYQRGYRRIGVLGTDDLDRRFQYQSVAAAKVFAHLHRDVFVDQLNLEPDLPDDQKARETKAWLKRGRMDAVLSQVGLYDELRRLGLEMAAGRPGYVDLHRSADPVVTCMDQNQEWIGRKATDVVVGMINRNEFKIPSQSQTIMIPSTWNEGATLPVRGDGAGAAGRRPGVCA